MEFIRKITVAEGILFSFHEFSSGVSVGGGGQCSDMFSSPLFDRGSKFSISQESFFLRDDLVSAFVLKAQQSIFDVLLKSYCHRSQNYIN